jgi:hypothetical protein
MIPGMENIYDVLRLLVNRARASVADGDIEKALQLVGQHEAAAPAPAPAAAAAGPVPFGELYPDVAQQITQLAAEVRQIQEARSWTPPPTVPDPVPADPAPDPGATVPGGM